MRLPNDIAMTEYFPLPSVLVRVMATVMRARPERTTYRITGAGRAELTDWTRELVATPVWEPQRFTAGLSVLDPEEAEALLTERLAALRERIAARRAELEREAAELPRLFLIEGEYELAPREAEAAWLAALTAELAGGTFPGLDDWAAFHRTGQMPAGLADR